MGYSHWLKHFIIILKLCCLKENFSGDHPNSVMLGLDLLMCLELLSQFNSYVSNHYKESCLGHRRLFSPRM